MRHAFADVPAGQIHYVEAGTGDTILLLHQTPRSWAEFRYVVPLLAKSHHVIAMDTLGFGESSPPRNGGVESVEAYAAGVLQLIDALDISRVSIVGHHTGGVIGVEVATAFPERVDRLVLSCTPLVDEVGRRNRPRVDHAAVQADGGHLLELWRARQPYYPAGRTDLLDAFIADALKAGARRHLGHGAVARYRMEERLPMLTCPVLLIGTPEDVAYGDLPRWSEALPDSRIDEIPGGTVALPDHLPEPFAASVLSFLGELR